MRLSNVMYFYCCIYCSYEICYCIHCYWHYSDF